MNERSHDMIPDVMLLDVSVTLKKITKNRYNKHLTLTRL